MNALLDTNVLIAARSSSESTPELGGLGDLFVSSLSWAELTKGLNTTTDIQAFRERHARLLALRRAFGAGLGFDDACVDAYDTVLAAVARAGGSPRAHVIDRMLAATALAHDLVLVSRDRAAFAGLDDLLRIEVR